MLCRFSHRPPQLIAVYFDASLLADCIAARSQELKRPGSLRRALQGPLLAAAEHLHATNMSLERLLALVRAATPKSQGRKPKAEKLRSRGLLTQVHRRHLQNGGEDNRGQESRKKLLEQGVELRAQLKKQKSMLGTPRWHLRYANTKVAERQAERLLN